MRKTARPVVWEGWRAQSRHPDPIEGIHELRLTILRLNRELGLTILLSSHLLNEVEQLCTGIAVLNQGRKVFEGPLANIRSDRHWLRLRTGDFAAAARELQQAGLITAERDGRLIELAPAVGADRVVRFLVEQGMAVHEIAPEEATLESFYLSLMKDSRVKPAA